MKPLLIMFVGVPGSGKTEFSRQLAKTLNAVTINSDAVRLALWGSLEAIQATHTDPADRAAGNRMTFGAMDYMTTQILNAGVNVIYDANANGRAERDTNTKIATASGAVAIVVRLQTPIEMAIERIQQRDESHDQRRLTEAKAREVVERFADEIVEPSDDENIIVVSGEVPFDEQLAVFRSGLAKIIER